MNNQRKTHDWFPLHEEDFVHIKRQPKGTPNKHILYSKTENGREYTFHATKGYRSQRLTKEA